MKLDVAKNEIHSLKRENAKLREALCLINELPSLIKDIKDMKEYNRQMRMRKSQNETSLPLPGRASTTLPPPATSLPPPATAAGTPLPPQSPSPPPPPPQQQQPSAEPAQQDRTDMVEIDKGVFLSKWIVLRLSKDPKKRISELMNSLFTREEMASSSITGKQTNAFRDREAKVQLDQTKVSAILSYIQKDHGGMEAKDILSVMRAQT
ncbi:BEN domain-containing protein 6-like [Engraulis encrasicolus]|uniref:BEN domain-containing protein 6-like n=1 Tax=Engraulis encrasicolus TaxID=184585 RepID=UPI002FD220B0